MLSPYRALDLTDEKGFMCGKMLADLGADVIKIEPPSGDPGRKMGPFYHDIPDPEKSLYWFAYNTGKRSITLDIRTADGKEVFKRLVETADFAIESFAPGYLDGLGLGYSSLSEINPRIILTSITPFGQSGPYRDYKTSDLVAMSLGGYVYLTGEPDRPPVRIGSPQVYIHAGITAASGTLIAHHHRQATGEGQWVDLSMQEDCAWIPTDSYNNWEISGLLEQRHGTVRLRPETGVHLRRVWRCKDGYVNFELYGGALARAYTIPLMAWMEEEGMAPDFLRGMDWTQFDYSVATKEEVDRISEAVARFFLTYTKAELWEEAVRRRCVVYPVTSPSEVTASAQLAARNYWVKLEHPELGDTITYPGHCIRASEAPPVQMRRPPLIGEHNLEVYTELGLSRKDILLLKETGAI